MSVQDMRQDDDMRNGQNFGKGISCNLKENDGSLIT